jgi:O-6-methylguanine DNA methyltransferase
MLTLREPQIIFVSQFASPIGTLWLASTERGLVKVAFDREEDHGLDWVLKRFPNARLIPGEKRNAEFHIELGEYFQGRRREFTCNVDLAVSEFKRIVLDEVSKIPFGATASYKDIAQAIGMPTATRAVGRALATNPVPVIVPCHRVVGRDGKLVGFGGGLHVKKWLLSHERGLLH